MRRVLLGLLLLAVPASAQLEEEDELPELPRYLAHIRLGDGLKQLKLLYPPAVDWVGARMPRGVTRFTIRRDQAKKFPTEAEILNIGLSRWGNIVEIQVIYHEAFTRRKSAEQLAAELSLQFGPFKRNETRYWWADGGTVLRVSNHALPVLKDGVEIREFRTAIQVMDRSLFREDRQDD